MQDAVYCLLATAYWRLCSPKNCFNLMNAGDYTIRWPSLGSWQMQERIFKRQLWIHIFAQLPGGIVQARDKSIDIGHAVLLRGPRDLVAAVDMNDLIGAAGRHEQHIAPPA